MLHPIKVYRLKAKLTQVRLADLLQSSDAVVFDLFNKNTGTVTEQWVRRLELGMVNPTTDFNAVASVLTDQLYRVLVTSDNVKSAVANVTGMLLGATDTLSQPVTLQVDNPVGPTHQVIARQIQDWYTITRARAAEVLLKEDLEKKILWGHKPEDIQRQVTLRLTDGKSLSEYALCRALGLHPFSVQTWTKENSTNPVDWPAAIRRALVEIGLGDLLE